MGEDRGTAAVLDCFGLRVYHLCQRNLMNVVHRSEIQLNERDPPKRVSNQRQCVATTVSVLTNIFIALYLSLTIHSGCTYPCGQFVLPDFVCA